MEVSLKYNLEEYAAAMGKMKQLKTDIEGYKKTMLANLEQLRRDWTLESGVAFFDSLDTDWADEIQVCMDALDDLWDALDKGYKEYSKIEGEANAALKI